MTRLVFKSLIVAGAFLFFGGHMPLDAGNGSLALPQVSCEAGFASCRVGETEIALGDRSPLLAEMAARGRDASFEDLKRGLADPELARLLDHRVIPDFAVAAAQTRLAAAANHIISGIDTGAAAHGGE